jgi:hypothetical protein
MTQTMWDDEDRINKTGTKAKCRFCGEWYGLDDYHGMRSPQHLGWELAVALERQVAVRGIDGDTDIDAALTFVQSVERGADYLERMTEEGAR